MMSGVACRVSQNASHDGIYLDLRPNEALGIQTTDLEANSVYSVARSLGAKVISILGATCGQGDAHEVIKKKAMQSDKTIKMEEAEIRLALGATCLMTETTFR